MHKKLTSIATASLFFIAPIAQGAPVNAKLKIGLSLGRSTEAQPVVIVTPFATHKECFAAGSGSLVNERVQIILDQISCIDGQFVYEYSVKDALVQDASGNFGIRAKHVPPSDSLLKSVKSAKEFFTQVGDKKNLKLITDAELGHWDVEPDTPIRVDFATQPVLTNKISLVR